MMPLSMIRVTEPQLFFQYQIGIEPLLELFKDVLADDFTPDENLLKNTARYIPYLWLLVQAETNVVYGMASLTDVIPGRHALVHGLYHPCVRKHSQVQIVIDDVLREAFETLKVHKLKAEFDADNLGAKGFCRRMGFHREAFLKADTQRQGQKQDVCLYTLFAEQYFQKNKTEEKTHVFWT